MSETMTLKISITLIYKVNHFLLNVIIFRAEMDKSLSLELSLGQQVAGAWHISN